MLPSRRIAIRAGAELHGGLPGSVKRCRCIVAGQHHAHHVVAHWVGDQALRVPSREREPGPPFRAGIPQTVWQVPQLHGPRR